MLSELVAAAVATPVCCFLCLSDQNTASIRCTLVNKHDAVRYWPGMNEQTVAVRLTFAGKSERPLSCGIGLGGRQVLVRLRIRINHRTPKTSAKPRYRTTTRSLSSTAVLTQPTVHGQLRTYFKDAVMRPPPVLRARRREALFNREYPVIPRRLHSACSSFFVQVSSTGPILLEHTAHHIRREER